MTPAPHTQCQPEADALRQHTPTPWVGFNDQGKCIAIMPAMKFGDICTFEQSPSKADADFILEAVNNHDTLLNNVEVMKRHMSGASQEIATLQARVDELESQLAKSCDDTRFEDSDAGCARAFKAEARVDEMTAVAQMAKAAAEMELGIAASPDFSPREMLDAADRALAPSLEGRGGAT